MEKHKPKIFITGSTGFIGRAIVKKLLSSGFEAQVILRNINKKETWVSKLNQDQNIQIFEGSLSDPNQLVRAGRGCEIWIHAAGIGDAKTSKDELEWTHIAGTENVIRAAKFSKAKRLIFISCADVNLHNADRVYWDENRSAPSEKIGHFSRTKLIAEELIQSAETDDFKSIILRAAKVWGPGDPNLLQWVGEGKKRGIRYLGKGDQFYCTTYIENLVHAVFLSIPASITKSECLYITDGELISIKEFFTSFAETFSLKPPISAGPYHWNYFKAMIREMLRLHGWWTKDVIERGRSTYFDDQRARNIIGYESTISLEQGMKKNFDAYEEIATSSVKD